MFITSWCVVAYKENSKHSKLLHVGFFLLGIYIQNMTGKMASTVTRSTYEINTGP